MADLPRATTVLQEDGGARGNNAELVCVLSCTSGGAAGVVNYYANVADIVTDYVAGEGVDFAAHYVDQTKLGLYFGKIATNVAAAIGPVDTTGVLGTSVLTFTGTPVDEEDLAVKVVTAGTVGTAGCEIQTSRDGGETWSPTVRLGTAVAYLIPGSAITVNFAAGTLLLGDIARCGCSAPMWTATELSAAFDALAAKTLVPRLVLVIGDCAQGTDLQAVIDRINAYETSTTKFARVICSGRDKYRSAAKQGASTTTFNQAGKTVVRSAGSFVTDGFKPGMTWSGVGTVNAGNAGPFTIVTVTALTLTMSDTTLVDEVATAGVAMTGVESKTAWKNALGVIVGATPTAQKISHRTVITGGRARRTSPISSTRKRRPASWPFTIRCMQHDVQISPAKKEDGQIDGWTILDANGGYAEYDERVDGGLLQLRIASLRTWSGDGGTYVSLPVTLDTEGKPMSRLPAGCVADIACAIVQSATEQKLNGNPETDPATGYITETEALAIESYVLDQLNGELLSQKKEGKRASAVTFAMGRTTKLVPGSETPTTSIVTILGTMEKITNKVIATSGGQ